MFGTADPFSNLNLFISSALFPHPTKLDPSKFHAMHFRFEKINGEERK
jgi:hypothetical protein